MTRLVVLPTVLLAAVTQAGPIDFKTTDGKLPDGCRAVDGVRLSPFTEDRTWNKCLRVEVSKAYTNATKGSVGWTGAALVGGTKDLPGFAVEPGKSYDVSFDLRGNGIEVGVWAWVWTGPDFYHDRKTVRLVQPNPATSADWKTFRLKFKTPEKACRAALALTVWGDTAIRKTGNPSVGDWFLVDNVSLTLGKKNLGGSALADEPVELRKAFSATDGAWTDDFLDLGQRTPSEAPMAMSAAVDGDDLLLKFKMGTDPKGHVRGDAANPWSGDTVETFVLLPNGKIAQFVFNEAGARYTDLGDGETKNDDWSVKTATENGTWGAKARIPFRLLGLTHPPADGEWIRLNVARFRKNARTNDVWCKVRSEFREADRFGYLLFGSPAAAVKREFGVEKPVADVAAYKKVCSEIETARTKAKFEKFAKSKLSVAVVPVVGDYSIPYLPEEIFDPVEKIDVRAAVNEVKCVPVAVANLSDRSEDYMVFLETKEGKYVGKRGLQGFPQENLTVRQALKVRDTYAKDPTLRFDPLPEANQTCSVTVAPKEAGLVWFEFDTTGVKPGRYEGRLRVVPLCEQGAWRREKGGEFPYEGEMRTIPFSLTVDPIVLPVASTPSEFYGRAISDEEYDLLFKAGVRRMSLSTWHISPTGMTEKVRQDVRDDIRRAAAHGLRPFFVVEYSAYEVFKTFHLPRMTGEAKNMTWADYVRVLHRELNGMGVKDDEYYVEIDDETKPEEADEIAEACRVAKEAAPTMRLCVTLGGWIIPTEKIMKIAETCDVFIMWRHGYVENPQLNREVIQRLKAMGKTVLHYSCETAMSLDLHAYYRQHPWVAERHGLAGNGLYMLAAWEGGAGAKDFKVPTYGEVIYRMYERPVPSVRFAAYREGATDVRYLDALRALRTDDPAVKAFLDKAAREVLDEKPRDPKAPDRMREEARALLLNHK